MLIIIYSVGSGKSSLLSALIGDMLYFDEEIIEKYGGREGETNKELLLQMK